jgi:histidinol-phosphatase (PHP family)
MAKNDEYLIDYVTQILAAIDTGDFLYIAHPDIIGTDYSPECVEREFTRLCQGAKDKDIPLELNLLGILKKRRYPCSTFFKIAAKVGNDVILGLDAHSPSDFFNPAEEAARAMAQILGLRLIDKPIL